jgi:hypothetical protein
MDTQSNIGLPETASDEVIFNNNSDATQAERIFQNFLSIYTKHNSHSVDEAMMFSLTSIVANLIAGAIEFYKDEPCDDEIHVSAENLISYEIKRYNEIFRQELLQYVKTFPEMMNSGFEEKVKNVTDFSELDFPKYMSICPSNISDVFNWENANGASDRKHLSADDSAETRKTIYGSVLQDMDFLELELDGDDESNEVVTIVDILTAFARYELHRHTSLHRLYYKNFQTLVDVFSGLYSTSLRSRFVKCSCCNSVSRDQEEVVL